MFAIQSRLTHDLPRGVALLAGLGGDGLQLLAPIRPGTRVKLLRRFTDKRLSRSRPEGGVVGIEHTLVDPDGTVLFRTTGSILVARRERRP